MSPPVTLRAASAEDGEFLVAVYASTRLEELSATAWSDEQKQQFCRMQFSAQDSHYRQHYPSAEYGIIEVAGVPAGRLTVDRWGAEIRVMDLALLPAFRGHGIGTHLLDALQREAAASAKTLSIHVERTNPALRLYQRLGFQMLEDKGIYLLLEWRPAGPSGTCA